MAREAKEDIFKLPTWAQTKLHNLQRQIEELKQDILDLKPKEPTKLSIHMGGHDSIPFYLPNQAKVRFYFDQGSYKINRYIEFSFREAFRLSAITEESGWNENAVVCIQSSSDTLVMTPQASNTLYIGMERRTVE